MRVVLDTNVLVSGLISPGGPPGMILSMVINKSLRVCYDPRILAEYLEVLQRPEFDISADRISGLLAQITASGEGAQVSALQMPLPDPDDMAFLEVALAAQAECIITGNLKHFPSSCRQGMRVFSPAEFLEFYRDQQDRAGGMVKSPSAKYRIRDTGDMEWTPAEVEQVIQGIRRSTQTGRIKPRGRKAVKNLLRR